MADEVAIIEGDKVYTEESYLRERDMRHQALCSLFVKMRDDWVQHRATSGVEARWKANTEMYYGDQDKQVNLFIETLETGPRVRNKKKNTRSQVVANIVRPKCDQATARLAEILLPVDDRNWAIKPTPVPQIQDRIGDARETIDPVTGRPTGLTADQEAQALLSLARDRAAKMQDEIDDNLTECNYNGEQRRMLSNGVILGTGIVKGPYPVNSTKRSWRKGADNTYELIFAGEETWASEALDPWNVYFDPACGNNHQLGRGVFERVPNVTRKMLRQLRGLSGYDVDAINAVLAQNPKSVSVAEGRVNRTSNSVEAYEMWIYHGEIEADQMAMFSERTGKQVSDVEFGVLVMVNDVMIGAMKSWVVDETLPYDVWCWREAEDSPYGYGLPDELSHQQRVINSAWRQVMDNARATVGGQIVMKKDMVIPADGDPTITPLKLWYAKDDLADVRQAFAVFEFNSHVEELLKIIEVAMLLADGESSMPQIMGGERGSAPETVGGMIMLYNNANAVLRLRVKLYDDRVTKPHISRYYDIHMLTSKKDEIKGDFEVDARGSSALVERDLQNQAMINLAAITNNPRYAPLLKERKELEAILKAFKLDPEMLMKTEQEFEQFMQQQAQQGQPVDPRIAAAEMQLKAKEMELQDRQQQRQFEGVRNEQELNLRAETLAYNYKREEMRQQQGMISAQMQREVAIAKMIQDGELTKEELAAKERLESIKIADGRERFNAEMYAKMKLGTGI